MFSRKELTASSENDNVGAAASRGAQQQAEGHYCSNHNTLIHTQKGK